VQAARDCKPKGARPKFSHNPEARRLGCGFPGVSLSSSQTAPLGLEFADDFLGAFANLNNNGETSALHRLFGHFFSHSVSGFTFSLRDGGIFDGGERSSFDPIAEDCPGSVVRELPGASILGVRSHQTPCCGSFTGRCGWLDCQFPVLPLFLSWIASDRAGAGWRRTFTGL